MGYWTNDGDSGWACCISATEWNSFLSAAGLGTHSAPASAYLLNEPLGSTTAADAIGSNTLTNSGGNFQTNLSGWSRNGWSTPNKTGNNQIFNNTTVPTASSNSALVVAYIAFTAAPDNGDTVMAVAGSTHGQLAAVGVSGSTYTPTAL